MIEKSVIIDNLKVHFYQSDLLDNEKTLVFLHGWGSQAMHLKGVFSQCENFIAIDLPGFGKSEVPKNAWTTKDYSDFLEKFLEKNKIKKAIFVGHSFGGSVIIKYCSAHPEVEKIVLIGSAGIRNKNTKIFFYKIGARIFNIFFALPVLKDLRLKIRKGFYSAIGSEDYINAGEMAATFQNVINNDLREDMRSVKAKAVLIWGENDKETPVSDARLMNELLENSELFVIPEAGHYVFLDNKTEFDKKFFPQTS
ncbi:MAG TPA: alpha/beta hydrolase [Patescibacteria group bacterium]